MKITLNIPDESVPAVQARVDIYNAGSGNPPITIEQLAQIMRDEETARDVVAKDDADKTRMAANAPLVAIGKQIMDATPEKQAAAMAAAREILDS